jgi:uncharacterized membrane protein
VVVVMVVVAVVVVVVMVVVVVVVVVDECGASRCRHQSQAAVTDSMHRQPIVQRF